jgi:Tol biopolymer transport system component
VIYFAPHQLSALWKVAASGDTAPVQVTTLDAARGERSHEWPVWSADGTMLVFTVNAGNAGYDEAHVSFLAPSDGARESIRTGGGAFAFVDGRRLLFVRKRSLMSAVYESRRLSSSTILESNTAIKEASGGNGGAVTLSPSGTLAYLPSPDLKRRSLVWISADGTKTDANFGRHEIGAVALSTDGRRIAIGIGDGPDDSLYLADSGGGSLTFLTKPGGWSASWSPDGKSIAASVPGSLSRVSVDAGRSWEPLLAAEPNDVVAQWTPDGRGLLFSHRDSATGRRSIRLLSLDASPKVSLVVDGGDDHIVQFPSLSPDGEWLAYESNQSGREEVYVQRYPVPGGRFKVSRDGGGSPAWTRSGQELYFWVGTAVMAAKVSSRRPNLQFETPRLIVNDPLIVRGGGMKTYDVAPDGRILAIREDDSVRSDHIVVVQNWLSELRARNAAGQK